MTQAANLGALGTNVSTSGIAQAAGGGTAGTAGVTGFKNRIINGAMVIDQRNAGASVTYPGSESAGNNLYTLDRWVCNSTGSTRYSVQRSTTAPTGFTNSVLITTTTAGTPGASDACYFGQYLEGFNVSDLGFGASGAQSVSISFWVRSSLTGLFGAVLANSDFSRRYAFGFTINSANTWEYKTVTIPGDTSGTWNKDSGRGFTLLFNLGGGSSSKGAAGSWTSNVNYPTGSVDLVATAGATLNITGVQLEVGTTATNFDVRSYGTELGLCQRYCYTQRGNNGDRLGFGYSGTTTLYNLVVPLPVTMRSAPTLTSCTGVDVNDNQAAYSSSAIAIGDSITATCVNLKVTSSGMTVGRGAQAYFNTSNGLMILNSEL